MVRPRRHNKSLYRSGLEDRNAAFLKEQGVEWEYETVKIPYIKPESQHTYTPDFVVTTNSGKQIFVETKGEWDVADRFKHLLIRDQHPELDIRFVFDRPKMKIKKGSKTTYADICEGRGRKPFKGVVWKYADKKIPLSWINE